MAARKSTGSSRRSAGSKKKKTKKKTTSRAGSARKKASSRKKKGTRKKTATRAKASSRKKKGTRKKTGTRKKAATRKVSRKTTPTRATSSGARSIARTESIKSGQAPGGSTAPAAGAGRIPTYSAAHTATHTATHTARDHGQQPISSAGARTRDVSGGSTKFAFIGSGQCGGRLAESFHKLGYHKVLALGTASHHLDDLDLPDSQKLLMDIGSEGAGKDMTRGREAVLQHRTKIADAIRRILHSDVDHVMLTIGCGGGTGSGSAMPLLETLRTHAREARFKNPDRQVGVLCTLPTTTEAGSPRIAGNAARVMGDLTRLAGAGHISPLIIVDNEKIGRLYPNLTMSDFWPTINNTVTGLFDAFNRASAMSTPYVAFDSGDYQSLLQCGGCCIMGLTKLHGDRLDLIEAMRTNVSRTLLAGGFRLETAKHVGAVVVGGRPMFRSAPDLQQRISNACDTLGEIAGNAEIYRGILEDDEPSLRVYTIFGGLEPPVDRLAELQRAA